MLHQDHGKLRPRDQYEVLLLQPRLFPQPYKIGAACHRTPCEGRVMRCDHCRRPLGPSLHRYWRMRFCSNGCEAAYLARLDPLTRQKLAERVRIESAMRSEAI